jgi:hypothetical protein
MSNIYQDGTYLKNNPSLHEEDGEYKLNYICSLVNDLTFKDEVIRVLDVGGGAGIIASHVCKMLESKGHLVECYSYDLSEEMLKIQKANNSYLKLATSELDILREYGQFHLTLLIDVIEHIPDCSGFIEMVNRISNYAIYNIPIEKNLLDWLRNIYMSGEYYKLQTLTLGHIHFFSIYSAKKLIREHHRIKRLIIPDFSGHILQSSHFDYVSQRKNKLRHVELKVSRIIYKWAEWLSPWVIQGSVFILAEKKDV